MCWALCLFTNFRFKLVKILRGLSRGQLEIQFPPGHFFRQSQFHLLVNRISLEFVKLEPTWTHATATKSRVIGREWRLQNSMKTPRNKKLSACKRGKWLGSARGRWTWSLLREKGRTKRGKSFTKSIESNYSLRCNFTSKSSLLVCKSDAWNFINEHLLCKRLLYHYRAKAYQ